MVKKKSFSVQDISWYTWLTRRSTHKYVYKTVPVEDTSKGRLAKNVNADRKVYFSSWSSNIHKTGKFYASIKGVNDYVFQHFIKELSGDEVNISENEEHYKCIFKKLFDCANAYGFSIDRSKKCFLERYNELTDNEKLDSILLKTLVLSSKRNKYLVDNKHNLDLQIFLLNIKKHLWTDFKKRRNYQHLLDEGLLSNVDPTQCKLETLSDEDSPITIKRTELFSTNLWSWPMADSIFGFLNKDIYTDSIASNYLINISHLEILSIVKINFYN